MSWIENGPVSTPPGRIAAVAAAALVSTAALSLAFSFHAVWRGPGRSALADADQSDISQAVPAKPIVEIPSAPPPPAAVNAAPTNAAEGREEEADDSNAIAARTAEVQAAQSQPAKPPADIDQILTSPQEKPQAPVDEGAGKTDVPF
jgi:hypothetical protein